MTTVDIQAGDIAGEPNAPTPNTPAPNTPKRQHPWKSLLRNPNGLIGLILTAVILLGALAAFLGLTPYDPNEQHPLDRLKGPSGNYLMGTDQFGRDVLSRVMAGAAGSLQVAIVAVVLSGLIGTFAGVCAGYFGGRVRGPVLAVTNILFAFPPLLLALTLASSFSRNWFTIAIAIAVVYIPIFVRVSRGPVLSLKEADFIKAAKVLGMSTARILTRHVLPNIGAVIMVQVTLSLSWAVLTEASLSFLGLGTPPPAPSLGSMVLEARVLMNVAWWTMAAPGAAIVLLVVGLNLLGDGLRDVFDPRRAENR